MIGVVGVDQGEGHRQVLERVGGQQQRRAAQVQFIHAERATEALQDHATVLGQVQSLGLPVRAVVDEDAQIDADLKLEVNAVAMYNKAIRVSRDEGDDQSRDLFSKLLKDEEEHVDWLEAQLHMIKEMGYERYLTMQAEGGNE